MTDIFPKGIEIVSALPRELAELAESMGQPGFRGEQIFDWVHRKEVCDPENMTNLPQAFRDRLLETETGWPSRCGTVLRSEDGTRKIEVILRSGESVETVLIPEGDKLTQCISTQVGCAVGCRFCRSGQYGLKRNLRAAEIVSQVVIARAVLMPNERLSNIVFMGVGEPLHNMEATLRALKLFEHPQGMNLSTRRITISTVGFVRGIDRLGARTGGKVGLAVSLHAADDSTRRQLVPGVKDTLVDIVEALKRYPLPKRRRITIEYVLVKGVNDTDRDARNLVRLLSSLKVKINLLPLNSHDLTDLRPPDEDRVLAFQEILSGKGVSTFLRRRRGADINAACGQLLAVKPDETGAAEQ
jgi:23S rRNA (adenine2503-C2)-methyltransferase